MKKLSFIRIIFFLLIPLSFLPNASFAQFPKITYAVINKQKCGEIPCVKLGDEHFCYQNRFFIPFYLEMGDEENLTEYSLICTLKGGLPGRKEFNFAIICGPEIIQESSSNLDFPEEGNSQAVCFDHKLPLVDLSQFNGNSISGGFCIVVETVDPCTDENAQIEATFSLENKTNSKSITHNPVTSMENPLDLGMCKLPISPDCVMDQ